MLFGLTLDPETISNNVHDHQLNVFWAIMLPAFGSR